MSGDVAIKVDHVSKKFARSLKRAMTYGLVDIARAALVPHRFRSPNYSSRLSDAAFRNPGLGVIPSPSSDGLRPSEFWALRDVSFRIKSGECIGLIGANGAGKSTLFSILSGIYDPSEGRIEINGRLQALIALGAGFHPMLTGRENIYINAAILGLSNLEINRKMDAILEFAGIGDFIDTPFKNFSSGMQVRLGFSVAAHLDPDILLVDEVLAVGDVSFQLKCQKFIAQLMNSGKSIMLVSHYMQNIQSLCRHAFWLHHGQVKAGGPVDEVIRQYQDFMFQAVLEGGEAIDNRGFLLRIHGIRILDERGHPLDEIPANKPFVAELKFTAAAPIEKTRFYVEIHSLQQRHCVMSASMFADGHAMDIPAGAHMLRLQIQGLPLRQGQFFLFANARTVNGLTSLSGGYTTPAMPCRAVSACRNEPGIHGVIPNLSEGSCESAYRWELGSSGLTLS